MSANIKNQSSVAAQRVFAMQKQLTPSKPRILHHNSLLFSPSDNDQAEAIVKQHASGVCEIQLNRPKALNSMTHYMCDIIASHLLAWEKSDKCKLITIKGNGGKAFCAGGDLKGLLDLSLSGARDDLAAIFNRQYRMHLLVGSVHKPYVALIDGITMGSGVGASINAPFRVATEKTVFAMPENSIGHYVDASASFWMPRLDGKLGPYLGLTGQRLRGADVFFAGIATHYVPSNRIGDLQASLDEMASKSNGALDLAEINEVIEGFSADIDQEKPFSLGGEIRNAINRCFKYETIEEIVEAVNNEKISLDWAKETAKQLRAMSPTSLKITMQLFREGARHSLLDCMRLEYQLAVKVTPGPEFAEGTRSTLVTRSKPNWNPPTLQQVNTEEIKQYYFDTPIDSEFGPLMDGGNYMDFPHREFMLPTTAEILQVAERVGHENAIKHLHNKYHGKHGVKAKVVDVLNITL